MEELGLDGFGKRWKNGEFFFMSGLRLGCYIWAFFFVGCRCSELFFSFHCIAWEIWILDRKEEKSQKSEVRERLRGRFVMAFDGMKGPR